MIECAGIHDIGYNLAWMECKEEESSMPIKDRQWFYTDNIPMIGEKRILKVTAPFDEETGDTFTTVFEPWQMFLNGWDCAESADVIGKACAVLCRFDDILWSDDFSAFISVKVLNTIPLDLLYKVIPVTVTDDRFFENFGGHGKVYTLYEDKHRLYRTWSEQSDWGQKQLIYTDDCGIRHEVMTNWYAYHEDFYYFGNAVNNHLL